MAFPAVNPTLAPALAARGYTEPTPVQEAVLTPEAAGRDLLVSAQTGSGKTVAYGLALAGTLLGEAALLPPPAAPLALVVAPTRELALQVHGELSWLYAEAGGIVATAVGGTDPRREQRALAHGCHIVAGTPGRLRDHMERGHLDVASLRAVVLDEADEMLDLGFREELEFILDATPPSRCTLLFSATIARETATLARRYQRDALRIDTVARHEPHGDIEYRAVTVAPTEIEPGLVNILRSIEARSALVFCATREAVTRLHGRLTERGFSAVALSGELAQRERNIALQSLRDGRARVCIATDVAARGIDVPFLDLVIHADLPGSKEALLHRSGRTGRAGRKGLCVLMVPFARRRRAEALLASANIRALWQPPPTAEAIRLADQQRLLTDPMLAEEPLEEDIAFGRELLAARGGETVAAAFVRLYRARLPAPEDVFAPEPEPAPEARSRRPRPAAGANTVWFRAAIGRRGNADPKWLVPLICRVGGVTRQDIGLIRIFDRESKFEITAAAAPRFAAALHSAGKTDIRIEPSAPPGQSGHGSPIRKPHRKGVSKNRK